MFKRLFSGAVLGMPTGRASYELNRGLLPVEDARHFLHGPFKYEWWYFDATFDDGHSAVVIIWPMNYSKPWTKQCTIQLSIYTPDGRTMKHYLFPSRRLFDASYERCDVKFGDGYIRGAHPHYEVSVAADDLEVDLVFEAETPGWKPDTGVNHVPFPRYKSMGWIVPLPRARVSERLSYPGKDIEVKGHGYHDHNFGEVPFYRVVDNWHWGHITLGDISVIWADITAAEIHDRDHTHTFLLSRGSRLVYETAGITVEHEDWIKEPEHLHPYPRRVNISFGSEVTPARGEFAMTVLDREIDGPQHILTGKDVSTHEPARGTYPHPAGRIREVRL